MQSVLDRLKNGKIVLADGAFGTMLIDRGLEPGDCPDSLNVSKPEIIADIVRQYLEAGAEIIHTSTFGASPMKLSEYGLDERTEEINSAAVSILKRVINGNVYVSASCGPSGRILKPYGDTEPGVLYDGFIRQMKALLSAGVDLITIETMTDLHEAALAIKAAKALSPQIPVIAAMTFDKIPRGYYTIMGVNIQQAAEGLQEAGADIIGSNCGNGIEKMIEIARGFKSATSLPVIIQSNAGKPEIRGGSVFYSETPQFFAEKTFELINAGVSIIGGCCGTTPDHIRAIKETIDLASL